MDLPNTSSFVSTIKTAIKSPLLSLLFLVIVLILRLFPPISNQLTDSILNTYFDIFITIFCITSVFSLVLWLVNKYRRARFLDLDKDLKRYLDNLTPEECERLNKYLNAEFSYKITRSFDHTDGCLLMKEIIVETEVDDRELSGVIVNPDVVLYLRKNPRKMKPIQQNLKSGRSNC